jgi:flavin-dependent dehydrogenase
VIDCEVLVCGGGCAGLGAALAAARQGAKTLLVERAGFAGGIITAVGLPYFDGIAEKASRKIVVHGIPLEFLVRLGVCAADAVVVPEHNIAIPNIERFKLLADQMLSEQRDRLHVLYHTQVCEVAMRGDRIGEVRLANKAGLTTVRPQIVIDCTGDGDVAAWSGAPYEKTTPLQPMTMHFRWSKPTPRASSSFSTGRASSSSSRPTKPTSTRFALPATRRTPSS